jgi:hypothetical protein
MVFSTIVSGKVVGFVRVGYGRKGCIGNEVLAHLLKRTSPLHGSN